ncbi:N-acetyltransferase family protein [Niveibacterium sp.]|uniref:GNAT family N-acetyltransferase n=1 Tax=Niveibacterium sp. TaxID=2017444 RepID=UPI0035B345DF
MSFNIESNEGLRIRPAKTRDATRIAALGIQVWLHTYATSGVSGVMADYVLREFSETRLVEKIEDPQRLVLIAEDADHLLGYAVLHFAAPQADLHTELETLYVQAHSHGQGIGRALLVEARSAAARGNGSSAIWLTVNARNDRAIAFYQRQGFVEIGETDFMLGGTPHRNLVMVVRPD